VTVVTNVDVVVVVGLVVVGLVVVVVGLVVVVMVVVVVAGQYDNIDLYGHPVGSSQFTHVLLFC
jgi:hypothetical protein